MIHQKILKILWKFLRGHLIKNLQKLTGTPGTWKLRLGNGNQKYVGAFRESNSGPLAPKARIIPLDQMPCLSMVILFSIFYCSPNNGWIYGTIETCSFKMKIIYRKPMSTCQIESMSLDQMPFSFPLSEDFNFELRLIKI